jgi:hypothetical protein
VRLRSGEDLKSQPVGEFAARVKALVARYALALWE